MRALTESERSTPRGTVAPLLSEALPSSEYYPVEVDLDQRLISFTRITRETYRKAAFLVPQQTNMGRNLYTFNLDDMLLASGALRAQARTHYILISAFCCSTLLARYLDQVSNCLVLREPGLVAQFAMLRYRRGEDNEALWEQHWRSFAAPGLRLMSRPFPGEETVVVKASDLGNTIGHIVLEQDPRSKVLLLSVNLRTFILSVLKSRSRREWTRRRAIFWQKNLA